MAVALIAQSAVGEEVWPADTPSKAMTISNGTLRIRVTSCFVRDYLPKNALSQGKSGLQATLKVELELVG
jgi:hypothetical protein